ncbi:hypothetical protein C4D60_Mb09t19650 [Musa balbisiana]|uniref:Bacterial surface antigen (D15) domain-containing protein n=1 Tax=Musa balbisiana TaxID=52838 RepID=A0A4S8IHL0_MUSBA|nr:hypothetical protein C4D60_Mb09t19650 [Musa balbisiana]
MARNEDIRFVSSSIKIPAASSWPPSFPPLLHSSLFARHTLSFHLDRAKEAIHRFLTSLPNKWPHPPLLCLSSLAMARPDAEPNPRRHGREDEERVLISEVLIRNKDGEMLEKADLEAAAAGALKSCRPNSALTVREVSYAEILSGGIIRLEISEAEVNNITIRFLDRKTFAYSHRNLFGRNQKLNLSLERGQIDSIFRINYTDPWINADNKRTSRTIMVQNSRTPGTLVHGNNQSDHGGLTIGRVTAGIEYSQPFRPKWSGTVGLIYQRAGARDDKGEPIIKDFYSNPLTASGNAYDEMLIAKLESVYTDSGDRSSSMFLLNMEQGLPFLPEWLYFNRVSARARQGYELGPARLMLSVSGGHVFGKFSPHEAFAIGGTNSVRGYEEGAVGSGRSYAVGSGEISFGMYGPLEGVLFGDYGSDLGSGPTVPGDPAGARGKPGSGFGYGIGIRVDSPLGPLRLEYAFNDKNARRFHFAVGYRN